MMEGYMEFTEKLRAELALGMGEKYDTRVHQVAKANAGVLDALTVFRKDGKDKISPNFYLLPLFGEYREGKEIEAIAEELADAYHAQAADSGELLKELGDIKEYGGCRHRVFFRLVNTGKNGAYLKGLLHFEVLDLSMVICILVREGEGGISSVPVQNRLFESWGVPAEEVRRQAEENTPLLFPVKAVPLVSVMADILRQAAAGTDGGLHGSAWGSKKQGDDKKEPFIMTNTRGINGFSAVLYPGALRDFARLAGKDLYVLPSSLHEALLLPADSPIALPELQEMVAEANASVVEEQDILSGSVYYYGREKNELRIAGEECVCVKL